MAWARLALIFGLLCAAALGAGLALRDLGAGLTGLPRLSPPADAPGMQIPPLGVTLEPAGLPPGEQAQRMAQVAAGGFGWVRLRVDWGRVEPARGQFAWDETDALIDAAAGAGLVPVMVLDGSPAWARTPEDRGAHDNPRAPPADPADFARFASAFADRYGTRVRFYQLWDEPNIAPHWGNRHVDPVGYAHLLRAASVAIRAADGDAAIVAAALAPTRDRGHLAVDEVYFLQRMIAAGAAGHFDAVAVQPFGFGYAPESGRQARAVLNFQRAAWVRLALVRAGLADVPLWGVRFGWNTRHDSPWGTVTPEDQAAYAGRAARFVGGEWPWLATLGWAVEQPAAPPDDPAWGFALTDEVSAALRAGLGREPEPAPGHPGAALLALGAAAALLAWRGWAAGRRMPWNAWRAGFQALHPAVQAGVWAALAIVYYFATWPPLVAACWVLGALLAWVQPQGALLLAAALLPFTYQHKDLHLVNGVLKVPPMVAMALVLLPATAAALWRGVQSRRSRLRRDGAAVLAVDERTTASSRRRRDLQAAIAAWILLNVAAAAGAWHWGAYLKGLAELALAPAVLAAAVLCFARTEAAQRRVLLALAGGGLLLALWGLVRWAAGGGVEVDGVRRLVAAHYSPNHTALNLVRAFFVCLGLALGAAGRARRGLLAGAGVTALALLLTASRGALLLGVPAGMATLAAFWALGDAGPLGPRVRSLPQQRMVRLGVAALLAAVALALLAGETRLANWQTVDTRLQLWRAAAALWRDHPWLGVGPGGFHWAYPAYLTPGDGIEPSLLHPHNVWLEIATGWGAVGLAWLATLIALWIGAVVRVWRGAAAQASAWAAAGLTAALVAGLAHAQVDAFLSLPDLAGWLMVAVGVVGAMGREEE